MHLEHSNRSKSSCQFLGYLHILLLADRQLRALIPKMCSESAGELRCGSFSLCWVHVSNLKVRRLFHFVGSKNIKDQYKPLDQTRWHYCNLRTPEAEKHFSPQHRSMGLLGVLITNIMSAFKIGEVRLLWVIVHTSLFTKKLACCQNRLDSSFPCILHSSSDEHFHDLGSDSTNAYRPLSG